MKAILQRECQGMNGQQSDLGSPFILPRLVFQQFLGENVPVGPEQVVQISLCNARGNVPNIKVGVLDVRRVGAAVGYLQQEKK